MPTSLSACDVHVWSLFRFRFSSYWFFLKLRVRSSALVFIVNTHLRTEGKASDRFSGFWRPRRNWNQMILLFEPLAFRDVHSGSSFFPFAEAQVNYLTELCAFFVRVTFSWVSTSPSACDVNVWSFFRFRFSSYRYLLNFSSISDNAVVFQCQLLLSHGDKESSRKPRKSFLL